MKFKDKIKLFPKVTTYFGFPTGEQDSEKASQKGVAIIITLFMITLMTLFMADMQVNAVVSSELAVANRDNLKAEYIAKSGANLANFLISVDLAIDLSMAELQGDAASVTDGPGDIWGQLNNFPIGGDTPELLGSLQQGFDLSKVGDSKVIDTFKLFEGHFTINVQDETSRINVNYCGIRSTEAKCKAALKLLVNCPAEKEYLDRKKIQPAEVVGNIVDWVDSNTEPDAESGHGSESDPYNSREPKVSPKNSFFDSLDELNMVAGWDPDMQKIFSPFLTVYPMPLEAARDNTSNASFLINFNSAPRELLNCLFPKAATECNDKSALYMASRADQEVLKDSSGITNTLRQTFCADDETTKLFTYRSDVYRVTVTGESGLQTKTLEYVLARQKPDDQDAKNQYKSSIKYLYWKML
ncbi:MAG: general secretion pathway protein GspK [Chitinophagaceae bacterium]|nr:general secretion pathway protein GspK [Oligoflexus sp.]